MHFNSTEEIISNEFFLAWYFKTDEAKAKEWENFLLEHREYLLLTKDSIAFLNEIRASEVEVSKEQSEAAYRKLQTALDQAPVIKMRPNRMRRWISISAAAAVIIFVIAGIAIWGKSSEKETLNGIYGKITEYKLPDGSNVTLNANSEIEMNKEWEKGHDREIWLKGEAFFKVQKTPQKNKFVVHTNTMDIIVTGTEFNVINRDDESSVLLTEGSVTVRTREGKEILMKPGDFVKIENNIAARKPADQEKVLAWKQSKLVFDNTSMDEVAAIITRYYGVKVNFSDSAIRKKKIGGGVMPNDNLDVLIQSLEATGEFRISKTGNELLISNP